jgi:hypothetical protein
MKMLSPPASVRSVGRIRWWTPLIAIACISCLPFFNVVAAEHHGGGGHAGGGGHPSASHGGGGSRSAGVHQGGYHVASSHQTVSHVATSHHVASTSHHVASTSHHVASTSHHVASTSHHVASTSRHVASTSHHLASTSHSVATANRTRNNSELRNVSPELRKSASANTRSSLYSRNTGASRNTRTPGRETAYNHSLTRSSVHGLMDRRLTQIGNRQWAAHGAVFSTRSDPRGGYWFQHGGYWWRGNFWGARSYCYNLIGLGFAPGLCWAWYDDICWGNIVIGMPYALIPYYYSDPVYTGDTYYNGEQATMYDYALPDGQYKQVTVVDGNVVDVEIVDQIG